MNKEYLLTPLIVLFTTPTVYAGPEDLGLSHQNGSSLLCLAHPVLNLFIG